MTLNIGPLPGEYPAPAPQPLEIGPQEAKPPETRPTTGGEAVYAIGDIHGCYDQLKALLGLIAQDQAASSFARRPRLIFLGDYVDRGPDSAHVLEALRWIKASPRFDACMLMGNHEREMLNFIEASADSRGWLSWGGMETLASYGVRPPAADAAPEELERARSELLQTMPASHLELLMGLELMTSVGHYAFVHAGVRPDVALDEQQEHDLLWIRDEFLSSEEHFGKVVVHGHTWIGPSPQVRPNRIGVDTGAYETGVLTAVRLHGHEVGFLHTPGPVA
jgi:serine/threonine protein phosphatase 1